MNKNYKISEPFFEYGPKCYMYGETLLEMAKGLDKLAEIFNFFIGFRSCIQYCKYYY